MGLISKNHAASDKSREGSGGGKIGVNVIRPSFPRQREEGVRGWLEAIRSGRVAERKGTSGTLQNRGMIKRTTG